MENDSHSAESDHYLRVIFGTKKEPNPDLWKDDIKPSIQTNSIIQGVNSLIPQSDLIEFVISSNEKLYCVSDGEKISFLHSQENDKLPTKYDVYDPLGVKKRTYSGNDLKNALNEFMMSFLKCRDDFEERS